MAQLKLITAMYPKQIQEYIDRGGTIVDFLKDSTRPCIIHAPIPIDLSWNKNPVEIAWNYANFREQHRFSSFIGNISDNSAQEIYFFDQTIREKILFKTTKPLINFYTHHEKVIGQKGSSELLYCTTAQTVEEAVEEVIQEFRQKGYRIQDLNTQETLMAWLKIHRHARKKFKFNEKNI